MPHNSDAFEEALLRVGYSPGTAQRARSAAVKGQGAAWARELFAKFEEGALQPRRGQKPQVALRLMAAGKTPENAHSLAKRYVTWLNAGKPADQSEGMADLEADLAQGDLFLGLDPDELSWRMAGLDLSVSQTAELLEVTAQTVRNWLEHTPLAPRWACDRLAAKAAELAAVAATTEPEQGEE